ncbi:MAG: hypothetical protein HYV76_02325 [Candidatus Vogelbacteria bacterium]|nr:hypothetical protein [Candidatus Vogelbacteria bacterium]
MQRRDLTEKIGEELKQRGVYFGNGDFDLEKAAGYLNDLDDRIESDLGFLIRHGITTMTPKVAARIRHCNATIDFLNRRRREKNSSASDVFHRRLWNMRTLRKHFLDPNKIILN